MIRGASVTLVAFDRRHAEQTRAWANDEELCRLLDRARPVSDAEHAEWFAALRGRDDCVFFAIETEDDARHIGNVWLWGIDGRHRKAELRVVIGASDLRGKGAGTEAIRLACSYGFERLNLHKVFAYVLAINPRALRAFQKAGFEVEGVLKQDRWAGDRYCDVYLLGRLRPQGE